MDIDIPAHEKIKFLLRANGLSLAKIARSLNLSQSTVTQVSQGRHRSMRVEGAIAAALHTTPEQLYPNRYPNQEEDHP